MKTILFAGLVAAAMTLPAHARQAEPADAKGAYAGVGVTHSEHEWMPGKSNNAKFFAGYDFSERWGVEAGTSRQGSWSLNYPSGPNGQLSSSSYKGRTSYIAAKLTAPVSDKFALQGKLGVAHTSSDFHFVTSGLPGPYQESGSSNGVYAGMGIKYKLTPRTSLSLELERNGHQRNGGQKNEAVSLNLGYRF